MKWLFVPAAAALSLAVATPALATPQAGASRYSQPQGIQLAQRDKDKKKAKAKQQQNQQRRQQTQPKRTLPAPTARENLRQRQQTLQQRQQRQRTQQNRQRYDWRSYKPGQRPPNWQRHRDFDRGAWMRNWRAQKRYHWRPYQRPQGWYYRRWVFGTILPALFWSQRYWIENYWEFGLPDPPYGYVWVRYGDDAMLVNVQTGYVLQVSYGLFY